MKKSYLELIILAIIVYFVAYLAEDYSNVYFFYKGLESSSMIIIYLSWIFPLLFSFNILVKRVTVMFTNAYMYYYYRLENRSLFYNRIYLRILIMGLVLSLTRFIIYFFVSDVKIDVELLLFNFIYYFIVLILLVSIGLLLFIKIRSDLIISYFFAFIILISCMFFAFKNDYVYLFTFNDIGYNEIISLIVINLIVYFAGKKLLNHEYYY